MTSDLYRDITLADCASQANTSRDDLQPAVYRQHHGYMLAVASALAKEQVAGSEM